ncbi:MAG: alkaline phosphatase family protein, partial [Candidatus Roseilinea sp.]|uniref:alkaline phosphatase family protein n=1 Tax=Candidatus Roseilinea sp. TaxID=2838777 RepID=UPI004048F283
MCSSSAQTKVLIVGLDGASPKIINQLAEQGDLPYLRALFSRAPLRPLESVPPYATPAAWSTIYTGLPPASHGILDFVDWSDSSMPLADSASLRAKPIWQHLSEQGKRVAMIAFPLTYPPPVVNGVMVSGLPAPHQS